jgi:hypothetical protein
MQGPGLSRWAWVTTVLALAHRSLRHLGRYRLLADAAANILVIEHHRLSTGLVIQEVEVALEIETCGTSVTLSRRCEPVGSPSKTISTFRGYV